MDPSTFPLPENSKNWNVTHLNDHLNPTTILLLAGFARVRGFKQL